MNESPLRVGRAQARRFLLHALGLERPHASLAAALAHHGYVQIDPINVCGRMHDLILRARVSGYREGDLMRHLHGSSEGPPAPPENRSAFEHHLPTTAILVALEQSAWPYLRRAMQARSRRAGAWSGKLTAREAELAKRILAALAERGPLGSDAVEDARPGRRAWGAATLVKATLQKLFFHGRVLISRRDAFGRRLYDLPGRVLPAAILAGAETTPVDDARWEIVLKLRQRRLVVLKRAELAFAGDLVRAVEIEGVGRAWILREDAPALEAAGAGPAEEAAEARVRWPRLLAPLDPLLYDRRLAHRLWDFEYTWEVYTPPAKRRRGYYALPLLSGGALVGHVDPKADRARKKLLVASRRLRRGHTVKTALRAFAQWLGLKA